MYLIGLIITNLLSVLCIFVAVLSPAHVKRGKSLDDFKTGRFSSDDAASRAVKGLRQVWGEPFAVCTGLVDESKDANRGYD